MLTPHTILVLWILPLSLILGACQHQTDYWADLSKVAGQAVNQK